MNLLTLFPYIIGGGLFLGMMFLVVSVLIQPRILRVVKPWVCRPGEKMEIRILRASPDQRTLEVKRIGDWGSRDVGLRTFLIAWLLFSFILISAAYLTLFIYLFLQQ